MVVGQWYARYPIFPSRFGPACVNSRCSYNTGFRLAAADAYIDIEFDDGDEAAPFTSFGDLCDEIMPDT